MSDLHPHITVKERRREVITCATCKDYMQLGIDRETDIAWFTARHLHDGQPLPQSLADLLRAPVKPKGGRR